MYFLMQGGSVHHVLTGVGTAAVPCGARLSRYDLSRLSEGKPTQQVSAEGPEGAPLCKRCEKREQN